MGLAPGTALFLLGLVTGVVVTPWLFVPTLVLVLLQASDSAHS